MRKNLNIFWSWGFIIGLFLFILNDHVLKSTFDNWFTGKLSDIAGLFIFPIFFSAFLPKYRKHIYWITALGFIWWKSSYSNGFIDGWNSFDIFNISRVIDITDLYAPLILPFSYYYFKNYRSKKIAVSPIPLILLSSFAFIATSRSPMAQITYNEEYNFQYSADSLKMNVFFHSNITNNESAREKWCKLDQKEKNSTSLKKFFKSQKKGVIDSYFKKSIWFELNDTTHNCVYQMATISVLENRDLSKLKLITMSYRHCNYVGDKTDKQFLKELFEKLIIKELEGK